MKNSSLLHAVTRGKWFILERTYDSHRDVLDKLLSREYLDPNFSVSLSERKLIEFSLAGFSTQMSANASSFDSIPKDSTVIFSLSGTMLKYGTYCSYGTMEVANIMREAVYHPKVGAVILDMDSGGGSVDSIAPLIEVVKLAQSMGKPVIACIDLCASACYYVACFCDEIIANNAISSEIGSIGVMMSFRTNKKQLEANGIEDHSVYSTYSEWKNKPFTNAIDGLPTLETRYELLIAEELNPLAVGFRDAVKSQRPNLNMEIEGILSGRMFFANQAKEYGLIDHVGNMEFAVGRAKAVKNKMLAKSFINQ